MIRIPDSYRNSAFFTKIKLRLQTGTATHCGGDDRIVLHDYVHQFGVFFHHIDSNGSEKWYK